MIFFYSSGLLLMSTDINIVSEKLSSLKTTPISFSIHDKNQYFHVSYPYDV